jgi:presenilin-like A22 family membrane protease
MDQNQTETLTNLVKLCNVIFILLGLVASLSTAAIYKEENKNLRNDSNNLIKFTFLTGCFHMVTICCCMTTKCMIKKKCNIKVISILYYLGRLLFSMDTRV